MKFALLVLILVFQSTFNSVALAEESSTESLSVQGNCSLPDWNGGSVNYDKSCKNIEVKDCVIHAQCRRVDGETYRDATFSLDVFYNKCPTSWGKRTLSNSDGWLCCNWAGQPRMCGT